MATMGMAPILAAKKCLLPSAPVRPEVEEFLKARG